MPHGKALKSAFLFSGKGLSEYKSEKIMNKEMLPLIYCTDNEWNENWRRL